MIARSSLFSAFQLLVNFNSLELLLEITACELVHYIGYSLPIIRIY